MKQLDVLLFLRFHFPFFHFISISTHLFFKIKGNGLPTLATTQEIVSALEDSGFEVLDVFDASKGVHSKHEIPWYYTLYGSFTLKGFRMTRLGRICTHALVSTLEFLRIAPKGSVRVSSLLNAAALDLVEGGRTEIFTPSLFFVARKK